MASLSRFFQVTSVIWALVSDGDQAYIFKYSKEEIVFDEKVLAMRGAIGGAAFSAQASPRKDPQPFESRIAVVKYLIPAIAAKLQQALDAKAFDCLVIVAPRDTMNALQDALSEEVRSRTLINMPEGYAYDKNGVMYAFQKEDPSESVVDAATQYGNLSPSCTRIEGENEPLHASASV